MLQLLIAALLLAVLATDCIIIAAIRKLESRSGILEDRYEQLDKKVKEIPVDQIGAIYDSEKQFQEGLANLMNYGLQEYGLKKEGVTHGT